MRIAFLGTPDFAVQSLRELVAEGHEVAAVYTRPPAPRGRGHELRPSPVHAFAEAAGLEVRTPRSFRYAEVIEPFRALDLDAAVVVAYGHILPREVLEAPRFGAWNLHASLLPRWRGAAPIERAILAGDAETGISIFRMEEGLDTGPVYAMWPLPIGPSTTATELHQRLAALAAETITGVVEGIAAGSLRAEPQPEAGITYARKLERMEGRLDFTEPAELIERRLRALNPAPGCWCEARGERLGLLASSVVAGTGAPGTVLALPLTIACGQDALAITQVQRAGKRPMTADELQRGFALPVGTRLG